MRQSAVSSFFPSMGFFFSLFFLTLISLIFSVVWVIFHMKKWNTIHKTLCPVFPPQVEKCVKVSSSVIQRSVMKMKMKNVASPGKRVSESEYSLSCFILHRHLALADSFFFSFFSFSFNSRVPWQDHFLLLYEVWLTVEFILYVCFHNSLTAERTGLEICFLLCLVLFFSCLQAHGIKNKRYGEM